LIFLGASDIRQCRKEESASTDLRRTFPDIDYAMLGYDIIKGFPESNSHDPGFSHRIFVVDYTKDLLTADCRYSVPKGFVIIPDVSKRDTILRLKIGTQRVHVSAKKCDSHFHHLL
jgi:hypothetical protein